MTSNRQVTNKCDGCRNRFDGAPVLHDDVWQQLADPNEILCAECMFRRAIERQVHVTLESLKPCAFNLFHWPRSWFNLFASINPPPTIVHPEWREAAPALRRIVARQDGAP